MKKTNLLILFICIILCGCVILCGCNNLPTGTSAETPTDSLTDSSAISDGEIIECIPYGEVFETLEELLTYMEKVSADLENLSPQEFDAKHFIPTQTLVTAMEYFETQPLPIATDDVWQLSAVELLDYPDGGVIMKWHYVSAEEENERRLSFSCPLSEPLTLPDAAPLGVIAWGDLTVLMQEENWLGPIGYVATGDVIYSVQFGGGAPATEATLYGMEMLTLESISLAKE